MVHSQRIDNRRPKKTPTIVIDERDVPEPELPPNAAVDPAIANAPVRTVNFVEVGDMVGKQLQLILQRLNATHDTVKGGIHYFLPVRHGKIGSDIIFEEEFERIGRELFEVVNESNNLIQNATIKLKGGAKDVVVVRRSV